MKKKVFFFLLIFNTAFKLAQGYSTLKTDSLSILIKLNDQRTREEKLTKYIRNNLWNSTTDSVERRKKNIVSVLSKSKIENEIALIHYTEGIAQKCLFHKEAARIAMVKAIERLDKNDDHYLSYVFLLNLAFIQTDEGDAIGAISSYRLAKKEAVNLDDIYAQLKIDVDISDVFYKYGFFNLSLSYLNIAEEIINKYNLHDDNLRVDIYDNKCENFFRMKNRDSLKKYNARLKGLKSNIGENYTFQKRTDYYLSLLNADLPNAINLIHEVEKDKLYHFDNIDKQNLADAFFKAGQNDSAINTINKLLADTMEDNHPEIRFRQYEILGQIAENKNDYKLAAYYLQKAMEQSQEDVNRLTQAGNVVSQIKIDEIEGAYDQKDQIFKKQRIWLMFAVVVALLVILIITIFYRSIKQKRHYEKLLFMAQKEELAFINSHEVRRHLSNILGIIDLLKHSEQKESEYEEFEDHLFHSAESLDEAIKSFAERLDD